MLVAPREATFLASFSAVCESPALNLFRESSALKSSHHGKVKGHSPGSTSLILTLIDKQVRGTNA